MSSTNTTPNFGLPQYIATDKPTYLGDFNKAMLDIDTNMKTIENKAVSAESSVATANSNANQALENSGNAQTTAEQAQATATQAQATATQAQTVATQAQATATSANQTATESKELAQTVKNTVDNIPGWILTDNIALPTINGSAPQEGKISCNYSERLKLLNIYGNIKFNAISGTNIFAKLPNNIKISENRTIALGFYDAETDTELTGTIDTDGNIKIDGGARVRSLYMNLLLCINGWN